MSLNKTKSVYVLLSKNSICPEKVHTRQQFAFNCDSIYIENVKYKAPVEKTLY